MTDKEAVTVRIMFAFTLHRGINEGHAQFVAIAFHDQLKEAFARKLRLKTMELRERGCSVWATTALQQREASLLSK